MVPKYLLLLCYPFVCKYGYELCLMLNKDAWLIESTVVLKLTLRHKTDFTSFSEFFD